MKGKRILAGLLTVAMVSGLCPWALAEDAYVSSDAYVAPANVTTSAGQTFYDVYGGKTTDRQTDLKLFYGNALENKDTTSNVGVKYDDSYHTPYQTWLDTAASLYATNDTVTPGTDKVDAGKLSDWWKALFDSPSTSSNNNLFYPKVYDKGDTETDISANTDLVFSNNPDTNNSGTGVHAGNYTFNLDNYVQKSGLKLVDASSGTSTGTNAPSAGATATATAIADDLKETFEKCTGHEHGVAKYLPGNDSTAVENVAKQLDAAGLKNNANGSPIYYATDMRLAEHGGNGQNSNQALTCGAIFYDFSVAYLETGTAFNSGMNDLPEDEELYDYVVTKKNKLPGVSYSISNPNADEKGYSFKNASDISAQVSTDYTTAVEESATNEHSTTKEYSLGESISATVGFSAKFFSAEVTTGFESSQMWNDTWTDSKTYSETLDVSADTTVDLPAHSQLMVSSGDSTTQLNMNYDYPVAITYKVILFGDYFIHTTGNTVDSQTFTVLGTFGNDECGGGTDNLYATGNLHNRATNTSNVNYETLYGNGNNLKWTSGSKGDSTHSTAIDGNTYASAAANSTGYGVYRFNLGRISEGLWNYQPYSVSGGKLSVTNKTINTKINGIEPLGELAKVKATGERDYYMTEGESFYLDQIPITGRDGDNVDFYGFDSSYGQWKLVDENGNEIGDGLSGDQAEIVKKSGYWKLNAKTAGTIYLAYQVDKSQYDADAMQTHIPDTVISDVITVTISEPLNDDGTQESTSRIEAESSLSALLGEEINLSANPDLTANIFDSDDIIRSNTVNWQAQDQTTNSGIQINNNVLTSTKAGTYKVRALLPSNEKIRSSWVEIKIVKSSDATLKSLVLGGESVETKNLVNVEKTVLNSQDTITIAAEANDAKATVTKGNGTFDLKVGKNTINVTVQAEDGSETTYPIYVTRLASADTTLQEVLVGGDSTSFDSSTLTYSATVPNETKNTEITATATHPNATVVGTGKVDGLKVGKNQFTLEVTAEDGETTTTYPVIINRLPSTDTTLESLTMDGEDILSADLTGLTVASDKLSTEISAKATHSKATVAVVPSSETGSGTENEATKSFDLAAGENAIKVVVTAEDGTTTKTYPITITRPSSTDTSLSKVLIGENKVTFNGTAYEATVPNNQNSIEISATPTHPNAAVTGTGTVDLNVGENEFKLVVTAEDGTTAEYPVIITRQSADTSLKYVKIDGKEVAAKSDGTYQKIVTGLTSSITIDAVATDGNAKVTGTGTQNLNYGTNTFTITVTAESGDTKSYKVVVVRGLLLWMSVDGQELTSPYRSTVDSDTNSVTLDAEPSENTATISGIGEQELEPGENKFPITVTAEDGTVEEYSVTVTKSAEETKEETKEEQKNTLDEVFQNSSVELNAKSGGYNKVTLSWNKVDNAKGYTIYRSSIKNGSYSKIATTESTSYENSGLTTGTPYYYRVQAYKTSDTSKDTICSQFSSEASSVPTLSKPSVTTAGGTKKVSVRWNTVSGATGYKVYRASSKNGTYKLVKTTTGKSWTNKGLRTNKSYYYKVRAYKTVNGKNVYSSYSSIKTVKTK